MAFRPGPPSSADSFDSDDEFPFPAPLPREPFSDISHTFSPHEFLASLRNRHQTLEDLRSELRTRSQDLERELVELVNRDYADFIGLGSSVKGGEQRVEDLKMGLLSFRREVEGVVAKLMKAREEVERELRAKEAIRKKKTLARNLLTVAQRIEELSTLLLLHDTRDAALSSGPPGLLEDGESLTSTRRLKKLVYCWVYLRDFLLPKIPASHPFIKAQEPRMETIRKTILIDLASAMKEARGEKNDKRCLEIMGLYADMDAEKEAVKVMKDGKR
ncbi:hypothetical protein EX30DRAFT_392221 [Ascodesmis nigricans]|uniref:Conserved oligomeric Golgi complex subunit 2 n=1 Tax=Ascodesmis nigricans TaxID=341454 RepID=A0A4S2N6H5_9PEZI|nr:hypothetical protein EX30DRAFT_392221 [Ascodesmis nigricans]